MGVDQKNDGSSERGGEEKPRFNIFDFLGRQAERLRGVLGGSEPPNPKLLPHSVRANLRTSAQLDTHDIRGLINDPTWESLGISFALKAIRDDKEAQKALLKELCIAIDAEEDIPTETVHRIVQPYLDAMPPEYTIKGAKAAQVSRQGPDFFAMRFRAIAQTIESNGEVPCIVAHSGFMALPAMLRTISKDTKIGILFPKCLEDGISSSICGYIITRNGGDTTIEDWQLDSNLIEKLGPEIVIVDDTKGTGRTSDMIKEEFVARSKELPKILRDEYVIDSLRSDEK